MLWAPRVRRVDEDVPSRQPVTVGETVPRYLVDSDEPHRDEAEPPDEGVVIERGGIHPVTWICSYVSSTRTFALYEGPSPEEVRHAARRSGLHVRRVFEVQVLDPYAYHASSH